LIGGVSSEFTPSRQTAHRTDATVRTNCGCRTAFEWSLNPSIVDFFDHSLNTAIARLRSALDDEAESPRYVETVARHGYRFPAPVEWLDEGRVRRDSAAVGRTSHPAVADFTEPS
jgi:hypothetical protein